MEKTIQPELGFLKTACGTADVVRY